MIPNQVNVSHKILIRQSQYFPGQHKHAGDCVLCEVELILYIGYIYIYRYRYVT
jgi:hypothetical protein